MATMDEIAPDRPALAYDEIEITPAMIRIGVATFQEWDPDREEIELMVGAVFLRMMAKAPHS